MTPGQEGGGQGGRTSRPPPQTPDGWRLGPVSLHPALGAEAAARGCWCRGGSRWFGAEHLDLRPSPPALSVVLSPGHPQPCTWSLPSFILPRGRDGCHPGERAEVSLPSSAPGQRRTGADDRRKPRGSRGPAASANPSVSRLVPRLPRRKPLNGKRVGGASDHHQTRRFGRRLRFSFLYYDEIPFRERVNLKAPGLGERLRPALCSFSDQCGSVTHDWRATVEDNLNDTLRPPGHSQGCPGPQPRVTAGDIVTLERHVMLSWDLARLHPGPVKPRDRPNHRASHMAKRNLGKQMRTSIKLNSPVK